MSVSIHRGVWNWLKGCTSLSKLGFSYGVEANGAAILIPNEQTEMTYLNGTEVRVYACDIVIFQGVTFAANDDGNITVLECVDAIAEWMEQKVANGEFPEMPEGCTIDEISVRNAQTGYAIAQDGLYAKYMVPFTIRYLKNKE